MTLRKLRRLTTPCVLAAVCAVSLGVVPQAAEAASTSPHPPVAAIPVPGCTDEGTPLLHAHSHNDYLREHPLCDAISHGFTSVEADVWLLGGELLVGHTAEEALAGNKTLQDEYLWPLQNMIAEQGAVYPGLRQPFQLVIELKGQDVDHSMCLDGTGTQRTLDNIALWRNVEGALKPLWDAGYLSTYDHGVVQERALKVVYSGDTPRPCVAAVDPRPEFFDGSLGDPYTPAQMPVINASWEQASSYDGGLTGLVEDAHAQGYKVRIWFSSPDNDTESKWVYELGFGVDFIGSDHLTDLDGTLRPYDSEYGYVSVGGAGAESQILGFKSGGGLLQGFLYDTTPGNSSCASVTLTPGPGPSTPYSFRTCDQDVYWLEFIDGTYTYVDTTVSADGGDTTTQRFTIASYQ
jgi:hypothetical protein